eukprot:scaffold141185_cov31-Prasinocladus_malaysianus.AAC.1
MFAVAIDNDTKQQTAHPDGIHNHCFNIIVQIRDHSKYSLFFWLASTCASSFIKLFSNPVLYNKWNTTVTTSSWPIFIAMSVHDRHHFHTLDASIRCMNQPIGWCQHLNAKSCIRCVYIGISCRPMCHGLIIVNVS